MNHRLSHDIYNLEFPSWISELRIGEYSFVRAQDYGRVLQKLEHIVSVQSEFAITRGAGTSAVTAHADGPAKSNPVIYSGDPRATALDDILLLLSVFTGREVVAAQSQTNDLVLADPRLYAGGGILRCSIPYKELDTQHGDVGFEEGINSIFVTIQAPHWQDRYDRGHFLILAREAFKRQPAQSAFSHCWTIWEHLFATMNKEWLSSDAIRQLGAAEKVSFLLSNFALKPTIGAADQEKIKDLAAIRNRVLHYGKIPEGSAVLDKMALFAQLTEFIVAKIFGLSPSNLFNTIENLATYMDRSSSPVSARPVTKRSRKA